jgi:hypothetical protein
MSNAVMGTHSRSWWSYMVGPNVQIHSNREDICNADH